MNILVNCTYLNLFNFRQLAKDSQLNVHYLCILYAVAAKLKPFTSADFNLNRPTIHGYLHEPSHKY